jgi:hypothetical protein
VPRVPRRNLGTRDFDAGRRAIIENWKAFRAVAEHANQRLYDGQAAAARRDSSWATFTQVTLTHRKSIASTPPICRSEPRELMAIMAATVG